MGRKKPLPVIENVLITDIAAEGNAIAKIDNKVLFVPMAIPGDVVDVQISKKKSNFMEGYILQIKQPSPIRKVPFCSHFGICGGCKWQHLPYEEQLKFKSKQVIDSIERIGKVTPKLILPIIPSDNTTYYRNKLEYTFSNRRWLTREEKDNNTVTENRGVGFHIPGMFDKVIDVDTCYLQTPLSNEIRLAVKEYAFANNLDFFELRQHIGFLRTLIVRTTSTGELMLIFVFFADIEEQRVPLLTYIADKFPQITSLLYVINPKHNDTINDLEVNVFKGKDSIYEEMEGLKFRIGPKSFYQTNSLQAYKLYDKAREFAQLTGNEIVYDLYTGTGTIANFVARQSKKVIGIEYVPEAIEDAKRNSELNHIHNTAFFAGDMKEVLNKEFIDREGAPDVMIIDPPRAGMHTDVINAVLYANPEKIVYVSCNPATQARDIQLLSEKYETDAIQPVDMFPHTHHVENIAFLRRRN